MGYFTKSYERINVKVSKVLSCSSHIASTFSSVIMRLGFSRFNNDMKTAPQFLWLGITMNRRFSDSLGKMSA